MSNVVSSAVSDIAVAIRLRRVWIALAAEDIGDQHRRTTLGPLWLLINYLAFSGTFIFVFSTDGARADYAAYVAPGLLVWFYIMEVIGAGVALFVREDSLIKGTTLPISVYVLRLTMQSIIRGGYEIIGCIAILAFCGIGLSLAWLWSGLGIVLVLLTAPAAITVVAFIGAFFPDAQFLVNNFLRVAMFMTPVFWIHGGEDKIRSAFYHWNPFTYYLEIVRMPILTGVFPGHAFLVAASITCLLWVLAMLMLGRFRKQLVLFL
jgi:lipopolysaccharide transport system permease protein